MRSGTYWKPPQRRQRDGNSEVIMKTSPSSAGLAIEHTLVKVQVDSVELEGILSVPTDARGVVLFAHGSGSTHRSPRNRLVADVLNEGALATLLVDLLTPDEQQVDFQTARLRFDIPFLSERLTTVADWMCEQRELHKLPSGLYGASTGAAAALVTAVDRPEMIRAVVSRGGRPDLAMDAIEHLRAPVLLIVGEADSAVIELNKRAMAKMRCPHQLKIVPGATHLFEEPGTLERVAQLTNDWFGLWLAPGE
jgi:dienelactone hydrolase